MYCFRRRSVDLNRWCRESVFVDPRASLRFQPTPASTRNRIVQTLCVRVKNENATKEVKGGWTSAASLILHMVLAIAAVCHPSVSCP